MQKSQLSFVPLCDLHCKTKTFPVVADQGNRMKDIARRHMLHRVSRMGADHKNGDVHLGYQIVSEGAQSELT